MGCVWRVGVLCIALTSAVYVLGQDAPTGSGQDQSGAASDALGPEAFAQVQAALQSGRNEDALRESQSILAAHPNSFEANRVNGIVLMMLGRYSEAQACFRKALDLNPSAVLVHTLLAEAYAEGGDRVHRDEERAVLKKLYADGQHAQISEKKGYVLERIKAGTTTIEAVEFYEPVGHFHFYYEFRLLDAEGHDHGFIALESDDADQGLFHEQHKGDKKYDNMRMFSLDRYEGSSQALMGFIEGEPSYDDVRARVVKIVTEQAAPAASLTKH